MTRVPCHPVQQQQHQSPSRMQLEEDVDPEHVHVLEAIPPGAGQAEGKVVAVAPFIGKHLLKHQVRDAFERSGSAE